MKKFIAVLFLAALAAQSWAASQTDTLATTSGTLSLTHVWSNNPIESYSLAWTSDASGNVVATVPGLDGWFERIATNPGDGATSPTANYDVTLTDADGADVLTGKGANRSQADVEQFVSLIGNGTGAHGLTSANDYRPVAVLGDHTLTIASAGNAKSGVLKIYIRRR